MIHVNQCVLKIFQSASCVSVVENLTFCSEEFTCPKFDYLTKNSSESL